MTLKHSISFSEFCFIFFSSLPSFFFLQSLYDGCCWKVEIELCYVFYFWNLVVNYVLHLGIWFNWLWFGFIWLNFFFFKEKYNEAVSHNTNTRLWLVKIRTSTNNLKVKIQMFYSKVQALIVYYLMLQKINNWAPRHSGWTMLWIGSSL